MLALARDMRQMGALGGSGECARSRSSECFCVSSALAFVVSSSRSTILTVSRSICWEGLVTLSFSGSGRHDVIT